MKQNERLLIDTPNESWAQRQMRQRSYAIRSRKPTPYETGNLRQTKQRKLSQLAGITQEIAAVLCTNLPKYWCVS